MADSPRKKLEALFNQIILNDNEIDFITSLAQDGEALVSSTACDQKRPDAKYLCENAENVAASLSGLSELQKVLKRFGKGSRRGELEYAVFQLDNGILLTYFLDFEGKTDTLAVVSATKNGLGLMRRAIDKEIVNIENLIKQL